MHAAGYNNRTLAAAMHVSPKAVSNWVNGKNVPHGTSLIMLERLLTPHRDDGTAHEQAARRIPTAILFAEAVRRLMNGIPDGNDVPDQIAPLSADVEALGDVDFDPGFVAQPGDEEHGDAPAL